MKKKHAKPLSGKDLVNHILSILEEALAEAIVTVDLHGLAVTADYFIICQGDNVIHNRACAERVIEQLALLGTLPWQFEGLQEGRWILIDYSDVVVHIMLPELRSYYNIEEMWTERTIRRSNAQ